VVGPSEGLGVDQIPRVQTFQDVEDGLSGLAVPIGQRLFAEQQVEAVRQGEVTRP